MTSDLHPDPGRLVVVFTTNNPIQRYMVLDALKQAHIPSMENDICMPRRRIGHNILVPEKFLADARLVLSQLPFPITTGLPSVPPRIVAARSDRWSTWILAVGFLLALPLPCIVYNGQKRG